jgi:hypothetical protein
MPWNDRNEMQIRITLKKYVASEGSLTGYYRLPGVNGADEGDIGPVCIVYTKNLGAVYLSG